MEETSNEGEALKSPPRRRRSTFFERRESFAPQPVTEVEEPCSSQKGGPEDSERHKQELQRYHDLLLEEKGKWKKEVKVRRNVYHDLRQQYQMAAKASGRSRMSYSTLSSEDIEFIKGKCNITKFAESQQKLHKSVKETRALYKRACELDDVILSLCRDKVNKITDYILDNSSIDSK